jgi:hypothetical protein
MQLNFFHVIVPDLDERSAKRGDSMRKSFLVLVCMVFFANVYSSPQGVADTIGVSGKSLSCPPPHLYIEPYVANNRNGLDTAKYTTTMDPNPVPPILFAIGTLFEYKVVAVLRDPFGNFMRFCTDAIWETLGDTGIISLSMPEKPYVCRIEPRRNGRNYIQLSDRYNSTKDTAVVDVNYVWEPTYLKKLRIVNAETYARVDSVVIYPGEHIKLKIQCLINDQLTTWIDIVGTWDISFINAEPYHLPMGTMNSFDFSHDMPGDAILTVLVGYGIAENEMTIRIPVHVVPVTKVNDRSPRISTMQSPAVQEYFNLRGQKLRHLSNSQATGMLFERIVKPDGAFTTRKTIPVQ